MRTFSVQLASTWKPERSAFVTIVIDVLRATTVIATALANGATRVVPTIDINEALASRQRFGRDVVLGGERNTTRIEGFDLGNSPAEYTARRVNEKIVVLTTTNGTRAIHVAAQCSAQLYTGALVNASATAERACTHELPIVALCAGTQGEFSLEDWICAGALADACAKKGLSLDDAAIAAAELFRAKRTGLYHAISGGKHAQILIENGFAGDVEFSATLDRYDVAPAFAGGSLQRER